MSSEELKPQHDRPLYRSDAVSDEERERFGPLVDRLVELGQQLLADPAVKEYSNLTDSQKAAIYEIVEERASASIQSKGNAWAEGMVKRHLISHPSDQHE